MTLEAGGRIAILTQSSTPYDREASVRLDGDVAEQLPALVRAVDALAA